MCKHMYMYVYVYTDVIMNHQGHNHSWNGSVMCMCCVCSWCVCQSAVCLHLLRHIGTSVKNGHNTCACKVTLCSTHKKRIVVWKYFRRRQIRRPLRWRVGPTQLLTFDIVLVRSTLFLTASSQAGSWRSWGQDASCCLCLQLFLHLFLNTGSAAVASAIKYFEVESTKQFQQRPKSFELISGRL